MPSVLTTASQAKCPHGGTVTLTTENTLLNAGGSPVLLESDIHEVVGCSFTVGPDYMPCLTVEWENGASSLTVEGTGVLTEMSIGKCLNEADAPQGVAIVSGAEASLEAV